MFITNRGTYCYQVMPFGLKNAGVTFQRLMDRVFRSFIGKSVSVYVDDIVVRSRSEVDHVRDLAEVFDALRSGGLSLNPEKCVFGVSAGKFLGFLISERGIDVNPERVEAILRVMSPRSVRDIQCFNGAVNYLARFCSKLADRTPLFRGTQEKREVLLD